MGMGREVQKGGDICILMADSCWGLTENNKILSSNYPSIKKLIKYESFLDIVLLTDYRLQIKKKNRLQGVVRITFIRTGETKRIVTHFFVVNQTPKYLWGPPGWITIFKSILDCPGGSLVKNPPANAGNMGSIPSPGMKIPRAMGQLSLRTTTTEPASGRACVPHVEKSPKWEARTPQLEKAHLQQRRPAAAKNKI